MIARNLFGIALLSAALPLCAQPDSDGGLTRVREAIVDAGHGGALLATPAFASASGGSSNAVVRISFIRRGGWEPASLAALLIQMDAIPGLMVHEASIALDRVPDRWTIGPDTGARPRAAETRAVFEQTLEGIPGLRIEELRIEPGRLQWRWSGSSAGTLLEAADRLARVDGLQALALSDPVRTGGRSHAQRNVLRLFGSSASARTPEEFLGRIATAQGLGASLRFRSEPESEQPRLRRIWVGTPRGLGFDPWSRWLGALGQNATATPGMPALGQNATSIPSLQALGRTGLDPVAWPDLHRNLWLELAYPEAEAAAATQPAAPNAAQELARLRRLLGSVDPEGNRARIKDVDLRDGALRFECVTSDLTLINALCGAATEDPSSGGLLLEGVRNLGADTVYSLRLLAP